MKREEKMKRFLLFVCLIATLLGTVACSMGTQSETQQIDNTSLGFSFSFSADWKLIENDNVIQLIIEEELLSSVNVGEMTLEGKLEDYLKTEYVSELEKDLKSFKLENEFIKSQAEGIEWTSFIYTADYGTDSTLVPCRFMQSFSEKDGRIAVMTLCCEAAKFSDYNKAFENGLKSFKFIEKEPQGTVASSEKLTNPAVEYTILCPKGWECVRNDGMISIKCSDGSNLSSSQFSLDADIGSLDVYMDKKYFPDFVSSIGDYTLIGEYEPMTVDKRYAGLICEYTASVSSEDYRFYQLITSKSGYVYSFLYTATEENYASHIEDVKIIFENITFTKG